MKIEMSFGLTVGEESSDNRLDCCSCCCCCCARMCVYVVHAQTFVHIHAQASARAHILQEMRHCVFRASQTAPWFDRPWNGWAHLICSWIFFFLSKATQLSLQPHNHQIIRVTESHVKYQTPPISFSVGCEDRGLTWVLQGVMKGE